MTMLSRAEPARYRVWLALIVLGGLAARLLHVSVALGSDDQVWIKVAREISAHAVHTDEPVYYTRLVWTWILILWGLLGSLSLEWTAVLMFVLSGLTTVFIAEGTRTAFDTRSALLAQSSMQHTRSPSHSTHTHCPMASPYACWPPASGDSCITCVRRA